MLKKSSILAIFVCFWLMPALTSAAQTVETGRYFVHTSNGFLKTIFGVQHEFKDGFTTEAVYAKRSLLKFFAGSWRFELTNVPKYQVAQNLLSDLSQLAGTTEETAPTRLEPASQVPWGVAWFSGLAAATDLAKDPVTVALLDTGVDREHPDLTDQVIECLSFTNGNTPWPACSDSSGHGTHSAGIIAAHGGADGLGLWGITPHSQILAYKVCDATGACWADDIAAALRYAADQKANVINLGLTGPDNELINTAITYAASRGALIVGPATRNTDLPGSHKSVLSVNAIDHDGQLAEWTADKSLVTAPGVDIESTWLEDGYQVKSGSSMAVAHVTGLAARIWQGTARATLSTLLGLFDPEL